MMAKLVVGVAIAWFIVTFAVLPNIHTGDHNALAMYVEFGLPVILAILGLILARLDRIEKLLEKK